MKIAFSGFENSIEVSEGVVHTFEIENKQVFTNICRSLASGEGELACEPYTIWGDDGEELNPTGSLLVITDPLNLPWGHKLLGGRLFDMFDSLMREDEEARAEIESLATRLSQSIVRLAHQVNGDYSFGLEWGLKQYLKTFAYSVERFESSRYLESLISFLDFSADMAFKNVLVFVNLKSFLSKNELQQVLDHVFFLKLRVLLLETTHDSASYCLERKSYIDQHFLEF